ncbi:F-box/LRR-repeat MAX2 homolog A-like [Salvia splendens]|uniref:F-box/LRR-repeat MAX2 homolog A-like n=1 Tax=Salvia splendens TaxID=180675 RepID=UPI001C25D4F2|nr:F-box/LRR-repeat MAX2 homolog A-like [Salvia splendens]
MFFSKCGRLKSLYLSSFYYWTDDVPPALEAYHSLALNLTRLDILNPSFSEGFKSDKIKVITKSCPNLIEFKASCRFDPRYIGFVEDEALVSVSVNCPKLGVLHLADTSTLLNARGDGFTAEDASINVATLIEAFSGLPLLEELVLDICNNVRDIGAAFEVLNSSPKLRSLKLGFFHGISMPVESKLDGMALCQGLKSLSIRNVGDLDDMGLIGIGRGCCRLAEVKIHGCSKITMRGMRTLASLLRKTLVDVGVFCCSNLPTRQCFEGVGADTRYDRTPSHRLYLGLWTGALYMLSSMGFLGD